MTDDHPVIAWLTEPRRAYLYRLFLAGGAILVATGKITSEELFAYAGAVAAFLGTALATANTSTKG